MHEYCAIEDNELLLKKWHNGNLITLYLKIEGSMISRIKTSKACDYTKVVKHMTKYLPKPQYKKGDI